MHYAFDKQDEILQHWVRGLGCHHLPSDEIKNVPIENPEIF